ncbi:hypothetical protein F2Q69_00023023 [Brassica cretica]|uniref:Uncharacterized protein n=1 Tax=Brassica cretica TaxID=69181 RepID=A0A8S9Q545_BRACR|nr:hypothetical protein F2Q69_00023023 [Brassica cretica]
MQGGLEKLRECGENEEGFLDTLSTKVPEHKFQRKMNLGTKNKQSSSTLRRTDPVQFGGWPSWIEWPSWDDRDVLVQSAKLPPRNLIKLALVSLRSEAP